MTLLLFFCGENGILNGFVGWCCVSDSTMVINFPPTNIKVWRPKHRVFSSFFFKKSNHHHVPQSQKSLKSHSFFLRRDALFVDICNILSFPEPASEKKPAPAVTKQDAQNGGPEPGITVTKQEAPNGDGPQRNVRCNVKSASTPSTPVKVSSRQISKSSGLMKLGERGGLFFFEWIKNIKWNLVTKILSWKIHSILFYTILSEIHIYI